VHYSPSKICKMTLIVGQALSLDNNINSAQDFDQFATHLEQLGLGKETLDCARIELLKLS